MTSTKQTRRCERHGLEYEAPQLWSRCPNCETEWEERRQREAVETERREREQRKRDLLANCGIEGRFLQATFDTFIAATPAHEKVKEACREFAEKFRRDQGAGLLLIGPPGTGKTHLQCALAMEVIQRHVAGAVLATARDIVRELRGTWRRDADRTETEVIEFYGRVSLLLLDEAGLGFDSDAERVQLFDIVDMRYRLQRPTVVASNLNTGDLRRMLGERSFDRIREGAQTLVLNWSSYRGRQA